MGRILHNVLQDGPLQAQPALPVLPHSRRPGNDFVLDQLGHGNITDLTRTEALGAIDAHPGSVLLEGAALLTFVLVPQFPF